MLHVCRLFISVFLLVNALLMIGCTGTGYSTSSIPAAAGRFSSVTNEFPGVVMVVLPNNSGLCTGSIVGPKSVLTATHCLKANGTYTVRSKRGDFQTSHRVFLGNGGVDDTNDIGLLIFDDETLTTLGEEIYSIASSANVGDAATIVGFGCNSVETGKNSGLKRFGTNVIAEKNAFLILLTPKTNTSRGIIGDANQAGTCFGDSGGPLFVTRNGRLEIAGVTHAGGSFGNYYISEFTNVATSAPNRAFLQSTNSQYALSMRGF